MQLPGVTLNCSDHVVDLRNCCLVMLEDILLITLPYLIYYFKAKQCAKLAWNKLFYLVVRKIVPCTTGFQVLSASFLEISSRAAVLYSELGFLYGNIRGFFFFLNNKYCLILSCWKRGQTDRVGRQGCALCCHLASQWNAVKCPHCPAYEEFVEVKHC